MEYRAIIKNGFVYQVGRLITWNNNWSIKELEAAWNSVTTYRGGMGERKEVQEGGVHTHTLTHTHTHTHTHIIVTVLHCRMAETNTAL